MSRRDLLIGQQAWTRAELERKIRGYKTLKVSKDKKPAWFQGMWRQTYTIRRKS